MTPAVTKGQCFSSERKAVSCEWSDNRLWLHLSIMEQPAKAFFFFLIDGILIGAEIMLKASRLRATQRQRKFSVFRPWQAFISIMVMSISRWLSYKLACPSWRPCHWRVHSRTRLYCSCLRASEFWGESNMHEYLGIKLPRYLLYLFIYLSVYISIYLSTFI